MYDPKVKEYSPVYSMCNTVIKWSFVIVCIFITYSTKWEFPWTSNLDLFWVRNIQNRFFCFVPDIIFCATVHVMSMFAAFEIFAKLVNLCFSSWNLWFVTVYCNLDMFNLCTLCSHTYVDQFKLIFWELG